MMFEDAIKQGKAFVIAEVGSNWSRAESWEINKNIALRQITGAANAGADAVKFQLFTNKELYGIGDDSERPRPISKYALPKEWLPELAAHAKKLRLEFMCTPFSVAGLGEVNPFVNVHKLASSEITHFHMIEGMAEIGKPTIISTGGVGEVDVDRVFTTLNCGKPLFPIAKAVITECVMAYPAAPSDYNFEWLAKYDGRALALGLSDHTLGNTLVGPAWRAGVRVFEKHFDCYRDREDYPITPDSPVSIGQAEFADYVIRVRQYENGVAQKKIAGASYEADGVLKHLRRLVATEDIKEGGELRLNENYGIYRGTYPTTDWISGLDVHLVNRKHVKKPIKAGQALTRSDF